MMKKTIIALIMLPTLSLSLEKSVSLKKDSRVREVIYHEHQVYDIPLVAGISTNLVLSPKEELIDWVSGFEKALSVKVAGENISIKPATDRTIDTNITIITNKRTYYFQVHNSKKTPLFALKFRYPQEDKKAKQKKLKAQKMKAISDPNRAKTVHYNYLGIGDRSLKPEFIFASNSHTFIKLPKGARVPAVFRKIGKNKEQLVNSKFENNWIIIFSSDEEYTLRLGDKVLCIKRLKNDGAEENKKFINLRKAGYGNV